MLSSGQMPDRAVKFPPIREYTDVVLSQMPWGYRGGGGLIVVGFDSYIISNVGNQNLQFSTFLTVT